MYVPSAIPPTLCNQDVNALDRRHSARGPAHPAFGLLGHSEAGLVALAASSKRNSASCGLILVSAAGGRCGEALRELASNPIRRMRRCSIRRYPPSMR